MSRHIDFTRPLSADDLTEVRAVLTRGGVIGLPTDTLYGLAADPFSAAGVHRIFELKGRPSGKAMPIVVAGLDQLERLGIVAAPELLARLGAIWPAPLTVVLRVARPFPATAGLASAAVRVPAHGALRALLSATGPVTATSANRSGEEAARSADEVADAFPAGLDLILDGGPSPEGGVSTLVDATHEPPQILRAGAYPWS